MRRAFGNGNERCQAALLRFGLPRANKPARAKPSRIASGFNTNWKKVAASSTLAAKPNWGQVWCSYRVRLGVFLFVERMTTPKDDTQKWERAQDEQSPAPPRVRPRLPADAFETARIMPGAEHRPATPFRPLPAANTPAPHAEPVQRFAVPPVPPLAPQYVAPIAPPIIRPEPVMPPVAAPLPAPRKPDELFARSSPTSEKQGGNIGAWRPPGSSSGNDDKATTGASPHAAGSALAFSNAAAGGGRTEETPAVASREAPALKAPRGESIECIGFDAAMIPRMRKVATWKKILADVHPKSKIRDDDEDGRDKQKDARERRDVVTILSHAESTSSQELTVQVFEAMSDLAPMPLALVAGEIEFPFDEMESLKATLAVVAPFVPGDKKLKETIDVVREVMGTPGIERARAVVQNLIGRVREAFGATGRGVPALYIESQTEPMLLEGRCYQKRMVMGKEWIRGMLFVAGDEKKGALPTYVPTDLTNDLPMFRRFSVRMVIEARPRVEQSEAAEIALKVVAMGRRVGR